MTTRIKKNKKRYTVQIVSIVCIVSMGIKC